MFNGADAHRVDATALSGLASSSPRETVLLVTDDGDLGGAATRVLEQEGYDVVIARHAGHAFLAALTRTRIDILISELTLDDMTGTTLAATLRRHHPALRSVFISDCHAPQPVRILVRPFTRDELLDELGAIAAAATSPAS